MKKLALVLCMVPAFARAEGVTVNLYPATQATYQSGVCVPDMSDFSGAMIAIDGWLMNQAQQGFKEMSVFGCYDTIVNNADYTAVYDDLVEAGYGVSLSNGTITVTWP